jgi:hypothetical protein
MGYTPIPPYQEVYMYLKCTDLYLHTPEVHLYLKCTSLYLHTRWGIASSSGAIGKY